MQCPRCQHELPESEVLSGRAHPVAAEVAQPRFLSSESYRQRELP
jgi:hypothetical protein